MAKENNLTQQEWQQLSLPVYAIDNEVNAEDETLLSRKKQKNKTFVLSPIVTVQLILCMLFLTFMYFVQDFMPSVFSAVDDFCGKEMSTSVYFNGTISKADLTQLFGATEDEA